MFLLALLALQADTLTIEMQVSWNQVESQYPSAEVRYALTDWPEPDSIPDGMTNGWALATTVRDTTRTYTVGVIYGRVREICVAAYHRVPPQPSPNDDAIPVRIEVKECLWEEGCTHFSRMKSPPVCHKYIP